jgi:hypothetical protein
VLANPVGRHFLAAAQEADRHRLRRPRLDLSQGVHEGRY